ncbi:MAG: DUF1343 domain-containing protein [bacterium]
MSIGLGFQPGIETLLTCHRDWLVGRRIGLVSHLAAVDAEGRTSAERLWHAPGLRLAALFGPEHGFAGAAGAGENCDDARHPLWKIPIHSLYGATRAPTPAMLADIDLLVVDLQDLSCRCYTYVSTLCGVLEAAAAAGKQVIVADRPVPLPRVSDGPVTDPAFRSFVACTDLPLCYGMTPGETAQWFQRRHLPAVALSVAPLRGYRRPAARGAHWPPWRRPSPAIVSWPAAQAYPALVAFEALGALDHGRKTARPFSSFGAEWTDGMKLVRHLSAKPLPGVVFQPYCYASHPGHADSHAINGVRMCVIRPHEFRPALTSVTIIHALQELYGIERVWAPQHSRPEFFDKLFGTDTVRKALLAGDAPSAIAARWTPALRAFAESREECLLYGG